MKPYKSAKAILKNIGGDRKCKRTEEPSAASLSTASLPKVSASPSITPTGPIPPTSTPSIPEQSVLESIDLELSLKNKGDMPHYAADDSSRGSETEKARIEEGTIIADAAPHESPTSVRLTEDFVVQSRRTDASSSPEAVEHEYLNMNVPSDADVSVDLEEGRNQVETGSGMPPPVDQTFTTSEALFTCDFGLGLHGLEHGIEQRSRDDQFQSPLEQPQKVTEQTPPQTMPTQPPM